MATNKLKGLTLIEIIVSLLLIAILVVGLFAMFTWSARRNITSQHQVQAQDFSRDTLEELLVKDFSATELGLGSHTAVLPACELKDNFGASRSYVVETITEGKKISVTTRWTEESVSAQETLYGLVIQK
jgi:Tfp pilus assembly protein PilV